MVVIEKIYRCDLCNIQQEKQGWRDCLDYLLSKVSLIENNILNKNETIDRKEVSTNTDDILINKIKELSKKLVEDNIAFPMEMDYFLIEQAMLRGASIAFQLLMEKETESITSEITTKNGLLYRNGKMIELPYADDVARKHGYMYAEQLVRALESKNKE